MEIHVVYDDTKFKSQIEYSFEIVFTTLGMKYKIKEVQHFNISELNNDDLVIYYGNINNRPNGNFNEICIAKADLFSEQYLSTQSLPKLPLDYLEFNDERLPILYQTLDQPFGQILYLSNKNQAMIALSDETTKKSIFINFDIIASSFFMLTRYEEVVSKTRDKFMRFPVEESIAYKEKFLSVPVVNAYIDLFYECIKVALINTQALIPTRPLFGNNKEFAVCITHDVDNLNKNIAFQIKDTLFSNIPNKIKRSFGLLTNPFNKLDLSWTIEYVMALEMNYGIKSSFFFMADEARYSLESATFKDIVKKIIANDFEVGLHPALKTSIDRKKIYSLLNNLVCSTARNIRGVRQHYLQIAIPETWQIFSETGLEYDTSLGFAGHEGFRAGYCLPFQPFNLLTGQKINFWEVPLTVMDATLKGYRKLSLEDSLVVVDSLLNTVKKYRGVLVFLWHPDTLADPRWVGWEEFFHKCLILFKESNPYFDTCANVVSWYKERR